MGVPGRGLQLPIHPNTHRGLFAHLKGDNTMQAAGRHEMPWHKNGARGPLFSPIMSLIINRSMVQQDGHISLDKRCLS